MTWSHGSSKHVLRPSTLGSEGIHSRVATSLQIDKQIPSAGKQRLLVLSGNFTMDRQENAWRNTGSRYEKFEGHYFNLPDHSHNLGAGGKARDTHVCLFVIRTAAPRSQQ